MSRHQSYQWCRDLLNRTLLAGFDADATLVTQALVDIGSILVDSDSPNRADLDAVATSRTYDMESTYSIAHSCMISGTASIHLYG